MPVFSDRQIMDLLKTKRVIIHPILAFSQIQGAKVDLRLSNVVYLIKYFEQPYYDPKKMGEEVKYGERKQLSFGKREFILQPGDFAIAPLLERVRLPDNVIGRIDGRSSLGRLGIIVHATAGGVDPGYSGQIICELSNLGKIPVALYPLMRIASMTLETLSSSSMSPYEARPERKYRDQLYTRLSQDYEFKTKILDTVDKNL